MFISAIVKKIVSQTLFYRLNKVQNKTYPQDESIPDRLADDPR